jgi:hypothetical protein
VLRAAGRNQTTGEEQRAREVDRDSLKEDWMRRDSSWKIGGAIALGVALALLGSPAVADEPQATAPPAAAKSAESPAPPTVSGMKAAVDPHTGKVRPTTPDEDRELGEAMARSKQAQRSVEVPQAAVEHANGMTSLVLGTEFLDFMNTTVATVNADGTVSWTCVPGQNKAKELVQSGRVPSPKPVALEEK